MPRGAYFLRFLLVVLLSSFGLVALSRINSSDLYPDSHVALAIKYANNSPKNAYAAIILLLWLPIVGMYSAWIGSYRISHDRLTWVADQALTCSRGSRYIYIEKLSKPPWR